MHTKTLGLVSISILAASLAGAASAFGDAGTGFQHYVEHEFPEAISACAKSTDITSRLVLALSHSERYAIFKNKADKTQAQSLLKELHAEITLEDSGILAKFLNVPGNAQGNAEAFDLLAAAMKKSESTPAHVLAMASFVDSTYGLAVNKLAIDTITDRLAPVRQYVSKGGTMPKEMQKEVFTSDQLLTAMIGALEQEKLAAAAEKCLVAIEEPALAQLESRPRSEAISEAIAEIRKAIAKRQEKFPTSTWFSAVG